jgi:hypothetical protein
LKTIPETIKKFILIGLSLFLFKSVLIVYAYVFTKEQYNLFNQSYYTASLLILFGSLGFEIAQTRIPIKTAVLFLFVIINIIATYTILQLVSNPFSDIAIIFPVIIYSTFSAVGGVLNFRILFYGKYQTYFWVMFTFASAHLLVIPAVILFKISVFPVLSVFVVIWFVVVFRLFDKEHSKNNIYKDYYKIGFSAFVINSAVSLGLAADKFIVNHFFTADIANTYTFAWGLTAPIFYIGSLIEKYLYAEPNPDKNRILKKGFLFSLLLIALYTTGIITVISFFPSLLPGSVSKNIFGSIFIFMITGYSVYVIFHFPLNTYLFKVTNTGKQKIISVYFSFIIIIFAFVFYYITNYSVQFDYKMLLVAVWIYIFILLITKALIIFKGKNNIPQNAEVIIPDEFKEIP